MMETIIYASDIEDYFDAFSCKIMSTFDCYKNIQNTAHFWKSSMTSYCLWGDNLTISGEANKEFVDFINPKTVLCSFDNYKILGYKLLNHGEIMSKQVIGDKLDTPMIYFENSKQVYSLFSQREMIDDYEAFYLDCSLKLRNRKAVLSQMFDNDILVSAVLCPYICENSALITAVCTEENFEKRGYARLAMLQAEKYLSGKIVYLFKEYNKNEEFYSKMNYVKSGFWALCEK